MKVRAPVHMPVGLKISANTNNDQENQGVVKVEGSCCIKLHQPLSIGLLINDIT